MKRLFGLAFLLVVMALALFVPMQITFEAQSIGRVWPAQEWRLMQDQTGRLTSVIRDNRSGTARQIDAYQFEQGDIAGLKLDVLESGFVKTGDTIVRLYSTRQLEEMQDIEAQLALYTAQLAAERSGDKPPVVQEAENRLRFAEQDLTLKEKNYQIQKSLLAQELVALTIFQTAENDYELAKIQVDIARKTLETVRTGLKTESVGITEALIQGLRARLAILRQKGLAFVLRAPFNGYVQHSVLPEELFILNCADAYIVQIPIRLEQIQYIGPETTFLVTDLQTRKTHPARFLSTGTKVEVLDNRQVSNLTALVLPDSTGTPLSLGVAAQCQVRFDQINQREYLLRLLNFSKSQ